MFGNHRDTTLGSYGPEACTWRSARHLCYGLLLSPLLYVFVQVCSVSATAQSVLVLLHLKLRTQNILWMDQWKTAWYSLGLCFPPLWYALWCMQLLSLSYTVWTSGSLHLWCLTNIYADFLDVSHSLKRAGRFHLAVFCIMVSTVLILSSFHIRLWVDSLLCSCCSSVCLFCFDPKDDREKNLEKCKFGWLFFPSSCDDGFIFSFDITASVDRECWWVESLQNMFLFY